MNEATGSFEDVHLPVGSVLFMKTNGKIVRLVDKCLQHF